MVFGMSENHLAVLETLFYPFKNGVLTVSAAKSDAARAEIGCEAYKTASIQPIATCAVRRCPYTVEIPDGAGM